MSIQVIGAGMGRTGTMSLKHALEILGFVKCHHMIEVLQNPSNLPYWNEMHEKRSTDYEAVFNGYTAAVDFPGAIYYKELMVQYPDAKVVLGVRDAEKWYQSCLDTIYQVPKGAERAGMEEAAKTDLQVKNVLGVFDYATNAIWNGIFKGRFEDKEFAIQTFNEWTEEVIRSVPAEKLLVFEAKEGWEPLCNFLGKPIPDVPYPRVNDTAEFQAKKNNKFNH